MTWLTPWLGIGAAAIAIPALLILYFLKLRRQELEISSTLLWKRAVQDLQVNAPIQKLKKNLLLLLQLLALAAALLALGGPVLNMNSEPGKRYVLLIDRSASMNTQEAGGETRLDAARKRAKEFVDTLRGKMSLSLQDTSDQAMVVAFDRRSKVMCSFTMDKQQLKRAIDDITPTDGLSSLSEAITVARASAKPPGEAMTNSRSAVPAAQLELFSDGKLSDANSISTGPTELAFHRVGQARDNLGVVAMQARRSYEQPEQVDIYTSIANYNDKPVETNVQLLVDGQPRSLRKVTVPAFQPAQADSPATAGKVGVSFELRHSTAAVIQVRQLRSDALPSDDSAWAVLPPPKKLTVLLVTPGNLALQAGLNASGLAKLDINTPAEFNKLLASGTWENPYHIVVLDDCCPPKLPRGRYIIFGRPPTDPAMGLKTGDDLKDQVVVDWRSRHPILQFVDLGNVFVRTASGLILPRDAEVLAQFTDSPAMALYRKQGSILLLVAFDVMESNWPFEPTFPIFWTNAVSYMGQEADAGQDNSLRVAQAITSPGSSPNASARITGPGVSGRALQPDSAGTFRFGATDRAGLYGLSIDKSAPIPFAVNLLDEHESDIAPAEQLVLAGEPLQAQAGPPSKGNLELWPYLALIALVLACTEWLVYNLRAKL